MYEKVTRSVDIPPNTGADGLLNTVRSVLRFSHIESILIKAGKVTYSYFIPEGSDAEPLKMDFVTLTPAAVIRNIKVIECDIFEEPAPFVMCDLFHQCDHDQLVPIALVVSPNTKYWDWHEKAGVKDMHRHPDVSYGIPLLRDVAIPEESVVLCGGYHRGASLIDSVRAYKAVIV